MTRAASTAPARVDVEESLVGRLVRDERYLARYVSGDIKGDALRALAAELRGVGNARNARRVLRLAQHLRRFALGRLDAAIVPALAGGGCASWHDSSRQPPIGAVSRSPSARPSRGGLG